MAVRDVRPVASGGRLEMSAHVPRGGEWVLPSGGLWGGGCEVQKTAWKHGGQQVAGREIEAEPEMPAQECAFVLALIRELVGEVAAMRQEVAATRKEIAKIRNLCPGGGA